MIPDEDGLPKIGNTGRTLGVRPQFPKDSDIKINADGTVSPQTGGMSVAEGKPSNLPPHRRSPKHDGRDKKLAVFELETDDLPDELSCRSDTYGVGVHAFVEPAWTMNFGKYQQALHNTRALWSIV